MSYLRVEAAIQAGWAFAALMTRSGSLVLSSAALQAHCLWNEKTATRPLVSFAPCWYSSFNFVCALSIRYPHWDVFLHVQVLTCANQQNWRFVSGPLPTYVWLCLLQEGLLQSPAKALYLLDLSGESRDGEEGRAQDHLYFWDGQIVSQSWLQDDNATQCSHRKKKARTRTRCPCGSHQINKSSHHLRPSSGNIPLPLGNSS